MSRRLLSGKGLFHHAAAAGNPAGPNCVLLLHCEGTDGSTTFTDSSGLGHVVTANGPAKITTAKMKFGTGCTDISAANDWLSLDGSSDFTLNGDFTVDCWCQVPAGGSQTLFSWMTNNSTGIRSLSVGAALYYQRDGANLISSSTGGLGDTNWHHIALTRQSGTVYLFSDGVLLGTAADANNNPCPAGGPFFGAVDAANDYSQNLNGYLDEVRVLNGRAAWTANFTPPAAPYTDPPPAYPAGPNCVLLLHCEGTDGSTSFPDSSGMGHVVTSHSGAVVGHTTNKFGGAAALGSTGYLTVGGSADFSFGTADFTIDMWLYITQGSEQCIISTANSGTISPTDLAILIYTSNYGIRVANNQFLNISPITVNAWTHVALVRASGVTQFYVNGVSKFSQADTSSYSNIANGTYIGTFSDGFSLNGYIDEIRILNGRAAWTANFTPPTAPYTDPPPPYPAGPNCVLLLHCDGTNGSTTFTDSSGRGHVITPIGSAQIDTTHKEFGTGSVACLASPASFTIDGGSDFSFGTGDFTIDFWVYDVDATGLIGTATTWAVSPSHDAFSMLNSGSNLLFAIGDGTDISGSAKLTASAWSHVAAVRHSGTTTLYLNGNSIGSIADPTNYVCPANAPIIGAAGLDGSFAGSGYFDEIRILNGRAAWTANFTPPTAPYTDPPPAYPAGPNCVLLLHCDGAQGSTTFTDSSGRGHVVTATLSGGSGVPHIDTTHPKFGGGAYYDNGGLLTLDGVSDFTFGTADFTLDCWVYLTAAPSSQAEIFSFTDATATWTNHPAHFINSDLTVWYYNGGGTTCITTNTVPLNQWTHVAWVRSSGVVSIYINGVQGASGSETNSLSPLDPTGPSIGGVINNSSYDLPGFLDEIRVLNGRAAWTANFTPPTAPYT